MQFRTTKNIVVAAFAGAVFLVGGFATGVYVSESNQVPPPLQGILTSHLDAAPGGVDFAPVWRSWNVLNEKFVSASTTKIVTDESKMWGMIQGLTASFGDPYTVFFPPVESQAFQ